MADSKPGGRGGGTLGNDRERGLSLMHGLFKTGREQKRSESKYANEGRIMHLKRWRHQGRQCQILQ